MSTKKLQDFEIMDAYPYYANLSEDIAESSKQVPIRKIGEVEVYNGTNFFRQKCIYKIKDSRQFVKIFRESLKTILKLSNTAQRLLWYILDLLKRDVPYVMLDYSCCMDACGFKTRKSVYDGIIELLDKDIIARTDNSKRFWVNPVVIFNGDRLEFIKVIQLDQESTDSVEHIVQS